MDHNTDKFFERLVGDHRLEPGAQAWEKIEANLAKKNTTPEKKKNCWVTKPGYRPIARYRYPEIAKKNLIS